MIGRPSSDSIVIVSVMKTLVRRKRQRGDIRRRAGHYVLESKKVEQHSNFFSSYYNKQITTCTTLHDNASLVEF